MDAKFAILDSASRFSGKDGRGVEHDNSTFDDLTTLAPERSSGRSVDHNNNDSHRSFLECGAGSN